MRHFANGELTKLKEKVESTLTQTQLPHRISLSQAAQLSGYHQDYLGQLCRLGKLRAAKIGRNWYTTQSELQNLVNNSEAYGLISQALSQETVQVRPASRQVDSVSPVASSYVISEVQDMPIRLEEKPRVSGSHHTLQTLITRMKLEELKTEVLQVTGLIGELSEEVSNHSQILKRHEQLLQARSDLREQYSPSLSFSQSAQGSTVPKVSMIDFERDNSVIQEDAPTKIFWLWPAFTILLAVAVSGIIIKSNLIDSQSQVSTIFYKTPVEKSLDLAPKVAGDETTTASNASGAGNSTSSANTASPIQK